MNTESSSSAHTTASGYWFPGGNRRYTFDGQHIISEPTKDDEDQPFELLDAYKKAARKDLPTLDDMIRILKGLRPEPANPDFEHLAQRLLICAQHSAVRSIAFAEIEEALERCSAVQVDEDALVYPLIFHEGEYERDHEDQFLLLSTPTGDERFTIAANKDARIDGIGRLILENTRKQKTTLLLLQPLPLPLDL